MMWDGVIPEDRYSNAWVIVRRSDGVAVYETWQRGILRKVNHEKYKILTTYQYLTEFNHSLKSIQAEATSRTL